MSPMVIMCARRHVAVDQHTFFNALLELPQTQYAYSFRPQLGVGIGAGDGQNAHYEDQLLYKHDGGYAETANLKVTYDLGSDTHPEAQDAAKVRTSPFARPTNNPHFIAEAIDASMSTFSMSSNADANSMPAGYQFLIDNEIVEVLSYNNTTDEVTVTRGQFGTTATSHANGAEALRCCNNLINQLFCPILTADGNTYLWIWDVYTTQDFSDPSSDYKQKWFNFRSARIGNAPKIWLEPSIVYSATADEGEVGPFSNRVYNQNNPSDLPWAPPPSEMSGPNVTDNDPSLQPSNAFTVPFSEWVRLFYRLEQRFEDYDLLTVWIATETIDPFLVCDRREINVLGEQSVEQFQVEFNSSNDELRRKPPYTEDRISYIRNFWQGGASGLAAGGPFSDANMASTFLVKPLGDS